MTTDPRALLTDRFLEMSRPSRRAAPRQSVAVANLLPTWFANGRDDHHGSPRALAQTLRDMADQAIAEDVEKALKGGRPPDIDDRILLLSGTKVSQARDAN